MAAEKLAAGKGLAGGSWAGKEVAGGDVLGTALGFAWLNEGDEGGRVSGVLNPDSRNKTSLLASNSFSFESLNIKPLPN